MLRIKTAMVLAAAIGLAACSNPNSYRANGANGAGGQLGISSQNLGSASNPASPAYFNQTVGNVVHFATDQSTLSPEAQQILTRQAQWLRQNADYQIIIEGNADERGTEEYNLALGARRAASAKEFLVGQGIAAGRIRTISYGKERPIATCPAERCWAQNRRAVTVLSQGLNG